MFFNYDPEGNLSNVVASDGSVAAFIREGESLTVTLTTNQGRVFAYTDRFPAASTNVLDERKRGRIVPYDDACTGFAYALRVVCTPGNAIGPIVFLACAAASAYTGFTTVGVCAGLAETAVLICLTANTPGFPGEACRWFVDTITNFPQVVQNTVNLLLTNVVGTGYNLVKVADRVFFVNYTLQNVGRGCVQNVSGTVSVGFVLPVGGFDVNYPVTYPGLMRPQDVVTVSAPQFALPPDAVGFGLSSRPRSLHWQLVSGC